MVIKWEVVGGADKGGILVREGKDVKSALLDERLSTGAVVEEICLKDGRLNYRLETGTGPQTGWISLQVGGKELLVKKKFDPYEILGIDPLATDKQIKSAYRKKSLSCHPDRNPSADAAAQFRALTQARDFLLNPLKRLLYNVRHGIKTKAEEAVAWWYDWDECFNELSFDAEEEETETVSINPVPQLLQDRPIDLLVFGATGLVGMLILEQIKRVAPQRTWAFAGRDKRKLQLLEASFGRGPMFRGAIAIEKNEDIEAAARTARVVLDVSGPKYVMGDIVAEACARAGTHVVDCTCWRGDVVQKALTKDTLDSKFKANNVCLVCFCGWSAAPHDMGVWALVQHIRACFSCPTRSVESYEYMPVSSPGTAQKAFATGGDGTLLDNEKKLGEFMLGGERDGGVRDEDAMTNVSAFLNKEFDVWIAPVVLPDRVVVRSSCGLLDQRGEGYGDKFLFRNWQFHAEKMQAEMQLFYAANMPRNYQKLVAGNKVPPAGSGPGERIRQEAAVTRVFVATADETSKEAPRQAYLVSKLGPGGLGDPLAGTAMCSLEGALCILKALDSEPNSLRSGFGTPVYHLAHLGFQKRLTDRGWHFEIHDGFLPKDYLRRVLGRASQAIED